MVPSECHCFTFLSRSYNVLRLVIWFFSFRLASLEAFSFSLGCFLFTLLLVAHSLRSDLVVFVLFCRSTPHKLESESCAIFGFSFPFSCVGILIYSIASCERAQAWHRHTHHHWFVGIDRLCLLGMLPPSHRYF